jgi:hypothetical protein
MFDEPTFDDFVARIEFHIQRSLSSARHKVQSIEHGASARGNYRSGNTATEIFREVLAEFEQCIDGALEEFRQSIREAKLDAREMRDTLGEHLGVYRDDMKDATKHDKLRQFSSTPGFGRFIDEQLEKFDEILAFKLRQFDVGFSHTKEALVRNIVIVHGDRNNVVTGDRNVAQQGTHDSQLTLQTEDINEKIARIETSSQT